MKPKLVTIVVLAALAALVLTRGGGPPLDAASNDRTTWGATDPTWAPDGGTLAFTLFGSIWRVAPGGGVARQITTSPGYHAHPAWSPKGGKIAFIRGLPPAGLLPDIRGALVIVDAGTGEERAIGLPYPTAGTPTWSPDGERIAVALASPLGGALLYEVNVASGESRPLQQRPQRGTPGNWIAASWNPRHSEIFFTGQRNGAVQNGSQQLGPPQVWSLPVSTAPISVQLPLSRYRLGDIAQLHSISALPDGSGAIYAAVIVNGKGDRDLFRVSREYGSPVALTNTVRDEFSPAVSPDGKTIAHVSNHLGNLDIFTMPVAGGEKRHVKIESLEFKQPAGRLRIRTLDEQGRPSPVRLFVKAADGKAYSPQGAPIFYYGLELNGPRDGFFLTSGEDELPMPAGTVRLTALKGIEYRIAEQTITIEAGKTAAITIQMERWTNWTEKGWWTGENHFHANYNGSYYQRPPDSLAWLEAEDLNTANMIVANSEGAFVHDKEFFKATPDPVSKPRFILYWGQEYRNSDPLGHMAFLNVKSQVPPSFTSVVGSRSPYDFPLNTMAAQQARAQGGLVVYVHPIVGQNDPFDTNLGAKEAPVTAALGAMDAIDVLPFGPQAYELWYRLLNCGFRIAPGAGTDVFTNWRGINRIPGLSRQYVEVGSAMSWPRWVERYRAGRAFVTNGPLLTFTVNGQPMGSEIKAAEGQSYRARISADISSRDPLETVELVRNGEVVESRSVPAGGATFRYDKDVEVDRSAWFALRVTGRPVRGLPNEIPRAHSAPVYIHLGGKPVIVREDMDLMVRWIQRLWASLEERNNYGAPGNRQRVRAMFDQALAYYKSR